MLFLGTSTLQNYSQSLGLHSPILMACTDAPEQRGLLTNEQLHQLERAFFLAKCAGSRINCDLLHVTFAVLFCREISNAREEWVPLGLALNWDNVISNFNMVLLYPSTFKFAYQFSNCQSLSAWAWYFSYMVTIPASVHLNSYNTWHVSVPPRHGIALTWDSMACKQEQPNFAPTTNAACARGVGRGGEGPRGEGLESWVMRWAIMHTIIVQKY
jgi:hypothetical protein